MKYRQLALATLAAFALASRLLAEMSPTNPAAAHWAFRTLGPVAVPVVQAGGDARTPVDAFTGQALAARGLGLSPEAPRAALLRRIHFDLTGLPPRPEDVDAFAKNLDERAYEQAVDRCLASPHFGEIWGRHWLDAAGYSDVLGGDNDAGTVKFAEAKWRYRDYVVRAFNADQPFDRFLLEQLAGDEMDDWRQAPEFSPEILKLLTATTFLRNASDDTDENELNTPDIRHDILHRTVEMVANNLLALTLTCARCHDHKYDPIPQRDYYAFSAQFLPALNPDAWLQPKQRHLADIAPVRKTALEAENLALDRRAAELRQQRDEVTRPVREALRETRLSHLPREVQSALRAALGVAADRRDEAQKKLVADHEPALQPPPEEVAAGLDGRQKLEVAGLEASLAQLAAGRKTWGTLHAVYDTGPAPVAHVLRRGEFDRPGDAVEPGFLTALLASDAGSAAASVEQRARGATSGRRLALAQWLIEPSTPAASLVARVQVNRIWQHLFGAGLVETGDNFGLNGARPTHPELLDWLTGEFIRGGWRVKPLVRQIALSAVYRQRSTTPESPAMVRAMEVDPGNQWLWHQRLRRLEAGSVRDALLAASGRLDLALGGPPMPLDARPDGKVVFKAGPADRRSLYVLARRNYALSLLSTFDEPVMTANCTRRHSSAVVAQSLTMLNDEAVLAAAAGLAERVARSVPGENTAGWIELAFRIVLSRPPDAVELELCTAALLAQQRRHAAAGANHEAALQRGLVNLGHTLLNSSEFLAIP